MFDKLLRISVAAALALGLAACTIETKTTPEPTGAEVTKAHDFTLGHASAEFDGPTKKRPAKDWVRAIVLQTTTKTQANRTTWSAKVILADESTPTIESKGPHITDLEAKAAPGNYIAYYKPEARSVDFSKGNITLIESGSVEILGISPSGSPSAGSSAS